MQDFRQLKVWQCARRVTCLVYESTRHYPRDEEYGLQGQMRRASVSICANLAEECGRDSDREFRRFVRMAIASGCELQCETILSGDLAFLTEPAQNRLLDAVDELKRMLTGLAKRLTASIQAERDRRPVARRRPAEGR